MEEGVVITDLSGRILVYNKHQAHMDRLDPAQALNRPVTEVYGLSENNSLIMRCIHSKQPIIAQTLNYRLPDPARTCSAIHSVFPLRSEGRMEGAICFAKDRSLWEPAEAGAYASNGKRSPDASRNQTKFTFSDLVGASEVFLSCLRRAKSAAFSKSAIMICGETGTGKEMCAQAIHNHSRRRHSPFVAVNCAAIPENLQESTLFGTSRGAFTGSLEKRGLFEEAMGGTLYLDEVDSMPRSLQAKLLRVLQEMKVRRVGGSNEKAVDVRIISSIKKDYLQPVSMESFRKDFYYRLSVVLIELPPLQARNSDIELLTSHFISKHNLDLGLEVESVSPEVLELFKHYAWPGNVRELEHVIEGAMNAVGRETTLQIDHLPSNFALGDSTAGQAAESGELYTFFPLGDPDRLLQGLDRLKSPEIDAEFLEKVNLAKAQNRREVEMLHQAVKSAGGNIARAARQLGVSRQLLHYKLKKYGIASKKFKKQS